MISNLTQIFLNDKEVPLEFLSVTSKKGSMKINDFWEKFSEVIWKLFIICAVSDGVVGAYETI